jgi:hypothetical protein
VAPRPVPSNGCEWASGVYLSETTINLLMSKKDDPDVKADIVAISKHNKTYETICPAAK